METLLEKDAHPYDPLETTGISPTSQEGSLILDAFHRHREFFVPGQTNATLPDVQPSRTSGLYRAPLIEVAEIAEQIYTPVTREI